MMGGATLKENLVDPLTKKVHGSNGNLTPANTKEERSHISVHKAGGRQSMGRQNTPTSMVSELFTEETPPRWPSD